MYLTPCCVFFREPGEALCVRFCLLASMGIRGFLSVLYDFYFLMITSINPYFDN
jgi:hypothetical protein